MAYRTTKTRTRRAATRRPATRKVTTRTAKNGGNVWSRQEVSFMRKFYRNHTTAWCARQLGRTVYSVRYKASDLSIKKSNPSKWVDSKSTKKVTRRATSAKKSWGSSTRRKTTRRATTRKTTRRATSKRSTGRKTTTRRKINRRR